MLKHFIAEEQKRFEREVTYFSHVEPELHAELLKNEIKYHDKKLIEKVIEMVEELKEPHHSPITKEAFGLITGLNSVIAQLSAIKNTL